jgi:hypothetical protein
MVKEIIEKRRSNPDIEAKVNKVRDARAELDVWRFRIFSTLLVASTTTLVLVVGTLGVGSTLCSPLRLAVWFGLVHILLTTLYLCILLSHHNDRFHNQVRAIQTQPEQGETEWVSRQRRCEVGKLLHPLEIALPICFAAQQLMVGYFALS